MSLSIILQDDKQIRLTIHPVDKAGQPAKVDGAPNWSSSDPAVIDVVPDADGLSALCVTKGPQGTAVVTVAADADLGSGVTNISDTAAFTVIGGTAVGLGLEASQPEDRP